MSAVFLREKTLRDLEIMRKLETCRVRFHSNLSDN